MKHKYKVVIHSSASKKLARLYRKLKSIRAVARAIDLNPRYVYDNLVKGIEPLDNTAKRREARIKLFLREHIKHQRVSKPSNPKGPFIIEWNHLPTAERHKVIKQYLNFTYGKDYR